MSMSSSMTDVGLGMMPYYNPLSIYRQPQHPQATATTSTEAQQHLAQHQQAQAQHAAMQQQVVAAASADINSPQPYWYGYPPRHPTHAPLHHQATSTSQQYLERPTDVLSWPHHAHYSHHLQYQHPHVAYQQHQHQQQQQLQQAQLAATLNEWSGEDTSAQNHSQLSIIGETSPSRTISGSEVSSPGTPTSPTGSNNNNSNVPNNNDLVVENNKTNDEATPTVKTEQVGSPFEWMNKPSYQSQANPGKTRTKDKYRVVYTDHQRLELEKEFHFSRYITIRRKAELAATLYLSERQVKIWFQNRRAKERKQSKKHAESEQKDMKPAIDMEGPAGIPNMGPLNGMNNMLGGLMHNGPPPSMGGGPPSHNLAGYPAPSLQAHNDQSIPLPVLGL